RVGLAFCKYRLSGMACKYHNDAHLICAQDQDPFMEDLQGEFLVGTAQLYLQPLAYKVEVKEQLSITDYTGQEIGIINLEVVPCNEQGNEYQEHDDVYVDSPQELVGKPFYFMVKILGCRGLPTKFTVRTFLSYDHIELILQLSRISMCAFGCLWMNSTRSRKKCQLRSIPI